MMTFKKETLAKNSTHLIRHGAIAVVLLAATIIVNTWTTMAVATDVRLAELLRGNLENAGLDISDVSLNESDGVVTLSGRVASAEQKQTLLDLVRRTHGVKQVIDELQIDYD